MSSGEGPAKGDSLADRFASLWEAGGAPPDVFAFLDAHPDATCDERLEVVRVDQRRRWRAGAGRPVEHYLLGAPALAERAEWIDLLLQEERRARQEIPEGSGDTLPADTTAGETDVIGTPSTSPTAGPADAGADDTSPMSGTKSLHFLTTDDGLAFSCDEPSAGAPRRDDLTVAGGTERFELQCRLGTGGMGVVYRAYDRKRGETVALKTMRRANPRALYRFKQEFRALADLNHPNLVSLYELFAEEDRWFFTMELIEGTDFVGHVRSAPEGPGEGEGEAAVDRMGRLRKALGQLAEGVQAIHDAGKLHRDIKPTNVLVTPAGRVVLLDFGLTTELKQAARPARAEGAIVGTVAYMAPEQGAAQAVGTAGDWYSVGVVLYEAMTGRPPFRGSIRDVLAAKQASDPPPPSTLVEGLPPDLDALCVELLRRDPAARPSGPEVLARLEVGRSASRASAPSPPQGKGVPLIGRERHLAILREAFAEVRQGRARTLFLFGRSGMGKSTLIQSFLDDLVDHELAVVLPGRCYERESVPYKALDSVVDALSRHLAQLGPDEARPLLPRDLSLLARVFPVLQRIESMAGVPRTPAETADQRELRRRAFEALRTLLGRIGARRPLVLTIDDLQWGDPEDASLLLDLLGPPDPPRLLFLGSFRSEDAEASPILRDLRSPGAWEGPDSGCRELAVEALGLAEARALALALLGQDNAVARAEAHLIARESHGNPLFIGELVKHAQGEGGFPDLLPSAGAIDLDEVLWGRVERLPPNARRLLEAVVVSGRPVSQFDASQAAGLGAEARASALALLRGARLIRATGPAHRDQVEVYHDRIRETVAARLPADVVAGHHRRLALALEATGRAEPEVLAAHFEGAGQLEAAGRYYAKAADRASEELAFVHAARLYRQALALEAGEGAEARRLRRRLGDALANAGLGGEAARAYLDAARTANVAEALDLRRLAAMQLLISGRVDEGLEALATVLGAMGLALPATPSRARLSLLWGRARLRLRGLGFRRRDDSQVSAEELARIDVCWSAVAGLSLIDPIRGADFQARGLRLALRAGEPYRVARALAMEAAHVSTAGGRSRRRLARLLDAAGPLADEVGHPHARGMVLLARAIAALMFGRWAEARDTFDRAGEVFRRHCTGVAWELDTVANLSLWAITLLGDLVELRRRWPVLLQEARGRGDLYASTTLNTYYMTILRLADDDPEGAWRELDAVMAGWTPRGFHIQHSTAFRSRVHIRLYRGEGEAAWEEVRAFWPSYERSMLLRIQLLRIELLELRARCALAAAADAADPAPLWHRAALDARRLERERMPWGVAHAQSIRAGLALARGRTAEALGLLADAARRYDAEGMRLEAAVARRRLGEALGNAEGRELVREADEWLAEQGIRDPARASGMLSPGVRNTPTGDPIPTSPLVPPDA